jgi:hypothetical protein
VGRISVLARSFSGSTYFTILYFKIKVTGEGARLSATKLSSAPLLAAAPGNDSYVVDRCRRMLENGATRHQVGEVIG